MSSFIPVVTAGNSDVRELSAAFEQLYGIKCFDISRAPGRVNVIGEHIDYCGYACLPAAIERDVLIAFATTPSSANQSKKTKIILSNMDSKYTAIEFDCDLNGSGADVVLDQNHHWSNYFKAGLKGMLEHICIHCSISSSKPLETLQILVTGSVPAGSGLSSSAAMTTATALCILSVTGRVAEIDRKDITNVAIESERLVGVNSGGMDQSASVFSLPDHLLHISFVPTLSASPIPIPTSAEFSFVIANTLVTSNKVETSKFNYNLRVVETRLGALLVSKYLNLPLTFSTTSPQTFRSVQDAYFSSLSTTPPHPDASSIHPACSPLAEKSNDLYRLKVMFSLVCSALGGCSEDGLTFAEVAAVLEVEESLIWKEVVGNFDVEPIGGKLKIWLRARHVLSEALRVEMFVDLLKNSSHSSDSSAELLEAMGKLMNESQLSLNTDFDCSCPELNEICTIAKENGAIACRLTGAGWGGATISLVPNTKVEGFIKSIRIEYYNKRFPKLTENQLLDACFATKPETGANLLKL